MSSFVIKKQLVAARRATPAAPVTRPASPVSDSETDNSLGISLNSPTVLTPPPRRASPSDHGSSGESIDGSDSRVIHFNVPRRRAKRRSEDSAAASGRRRSSERPFLSEYSLVAPTSATESPSSPPLAPLAALASPSLVAWSLIDRTASESAADRETLSPVSTMSTWTVSGLSSGSSAAERRPSVMSLPAPAANAPAVQSLFPSHNGSGAFQPPPQVAQAYLSDGSNQYATTSSESTTAERLSRALHLRRSQQRQLQHLLLNQSASDLLRRRGQRIASRSRSVSSSRSDRRTRTRPPARARASTRGPARAPASDLFLGSVLSKLVDIDMDETLFRDIDDAALAELLQGDEATIARLLRRGDDTAFAGFLREVSAFRHAYDDATPTPTRPGSPRTATRPRTAPRASPTHLPRPTPVSTSSQTSKHGSVTSPNGTTLHFTLEESSPDDQGSEHLRAKYLEDLRRQALTKRASSYPSLHSVAGDDPESVDIDPFFLRRRPNGQMTASDETMINQNGNNPWGGPISGLEAAMTYWKWLFSTVNDIVFAVPTEA